MLFRIVTFPILLLLAGACAQKDASSKAQGIPERTGRCDELAPRVIAQCQKCRVPRSEEGICPDGQKDAWLERFPTEAEFALAMPRGTICENNPHLATRSIQPYFGEVLVEPSTGRPYQGSADKGFDAPNLNVCADIVGLITEAEHRAMAPGNAPSTAMEPVPGAPMTTTTTTVMTTGAMPPQTMPPQTMPPQTTTTTTQGTQPAPAPVAVPPAPVAVPPVTVSRSFTVGPQPGHTHIKTTFQQQAKNLMENEKCKLQAGEKVPVTSYGARTGGKGHFVATLAAPMCGILAGQTVYFFASHFSDVPKELLDQVKALW